MDGTKTYIHSGRGWARAGVALAFVGLLVLSPGSLFSGWEVNKRPGLRRVTRVEPQGRGWVYETLRIYTVLKSHHTQLPDFSAWGMAKAITNESRRHDIDPMLILAIIKVESRFRSNAVSPRGARGLMQILPFVARSVAKEVGLAFRRAGRSLHDPAFNIRLGVHYLMRLRERFGDMRLALIAYNRGPTNVRRRLRQKRPVPPAYANKVMATRDFFNRLTPSLVANWAE